MKKLTKTQLRKIKSQAPNVRNMISSRGNTIPNQFEIFTEKGRYFQSYSSVIAYCPDEGKVLLDRNTWDYSVTTGRYRNQFLGEGITETRKKIESGEYLLVDLN